MKYELAYSKSVKKFLLKHRDISDVVLQKLEQISQNPHNNTLDIKPLKGQSNHYRLRVSKYRILYEIMDSKILIYTYDADSRGDIYK